MRFRSFVTLQEKMFFNYLIVGRSIRTLIPTSTEALGINEFIEKIKQKKELLDAQKRSKYDQRSKNLKALDLGT